MRPARLPPEVGQSNLWTRIPKPKLAPSLPLCRRRPRLRKSTLRERIPNRAMKLAVFDVCGTIYRSNTTYDFLAFFFRPRSKAKVLLLSAGRCLPAKVLWKSFRLFRREDWFRGIAVGLLKGTAPDEIRREAARFVETVLEGRKIEEVGELLRTLKEEGYETVLMSSSLSCVVAEVAAHLGVDRFFASELEVVQGRLTGRYADDIKGRKREVYEKNFRGVEELAVVTNNREDLDLLTIADRSWIVLKRKDRGYWSRHKPPTATPIEV